jgi:trigger factor
MRKKVLGIIMAASMVASLTACGGSDKNNSSDSSSNGGSTVNQEIAANQYADTIKSNAETYKTYISLPEYKGLSVSVDSEQKEVTDSDVTDYINNLISQYGTTESVTEGVTANGDTISLDYSGLLDGTAFSGGTATDVSYTIGSGKFIDDLDKGLVGLTVGEEYDIPCKFPDNYSSSDLAGKDVIFKVTVNSIKKTTLPELTDDWVASNASSLNVEATTVEGLKSYVKDYLETQAKTNYDSSKYQAAWKAISEQINTDKGYPEAELNSLIDTLKSNVQSEYNQYGSYYGISDFNSYLSQVYGFDSEDAFNDYAKEYAQSYLLEKMAITIIAENENITVSEDDINDMGAQLASYYGYSDYQEILDTYGNQMNSEVGYQVLYQKVQDFINASTSVK